MNKNNVIKLLFVLISAFSTAILADQQEGWFGIDVNVDGSGRFWNPVVESATINRVASGSPADNSRMQKGDLILAINDVEIVGARARELANQFDIAMGESTLFKMVTPTGEHYSVTLIAASRPE